MLCNSCQKENVESNSFCIYCGSPLVDSGAIEDEQQGEAGAASGPYQGAEQLRELARVVANLQDRVAALEGGWEPTARVAPTPIPGARTLSPQTGAKAPLARPHEPVQRGRPSAEAGPERDATVEAVASTGAPAVVPPSSDWDAVSDDLGPSIDWERVLGMNWFAIVGAVALTIGVGFFLRLAFENDWIGVTGRVVLGIALGLTLVGIGEYVARRYPVWAQAVTGGGISILYLSIFAAFGFYQLVDPVPALVFLALVVVTSGLLAIRYESLVIALLGIGGAFLTPILLGQDLDHGQRYLLVIYVLLVDAGILGVSTFRNWRWFTLIGLVASHGLFNAWLGQVPAGDLVLAQLGLTVMFLIFVGATTLFHILWRVAPEPPDMMLVGLNAVAYFAGTYGLLWEDYQQWFGFIALALSLFYGLVGYSAIRRSGAPPEVALFALATALVFLTMAMPLQLSGSWITVAWAAEGAVLIWVGFYLGNWQARAFGLGVVAVAVLRLLAFDTPVDSRTFTLLLNTRFPTFAVAIASIYVAAYLYFKERKRLEEWEEYVNLALVGAASFLTLWVLSAEVLSFFEHQRVEAVRQGSGVWARLDVENGRTVALTGVWAIYAGGVLAVALAKPTLVLRWGGLGILGISALKLLLFDTFALHIDPLRHLPLLNLHFLTFLVVLAPVLLAAYLYWRQRNELAEQEPYGLPALIIVANVLSIWFLSNEVVRFFNSLEITQDADLASAQHLSLTVMWALYSIGVVAAGMWRGSSTIRLAGVVLMGVPVAKLFAFDVFLLEQGFRVAAFVTLGVLLLGTGLAYQRYSTSVRGFLLGKAS